MYALITLFFEIATFRKGPQDVPGWNGLLWLLLPAYLLVNFLLGIVSSDLQTTLLELLIDVCLLLAFTWPLLYFAGKLSRLPQTLSALFGTDIVISLCAIPAVASLHSPAADVASIAMLGLMLWHWLVSGHIFRHALDRPLFFGLALAFLYILIFSQVTGLLLPEPSSISLAEDL